MSTFCVMRLQLRAGQPSDIRQTLHRGELLGELALGLGAGHDVVLVADVDHPREHLLHRHPRLRAAA